MDNDQQNTDGGMESLGGDEETPDTGEEGPKSVQRSSESKDVERNIPKKHRFVRRLLAVLVLLLGIGCGAFGILVLLTLPQPPVSGIVGDPVLKGKGIVKPVPQEVLEKWGIHIEEVPDEDNAAVNFKKADELFTKFQDFFTYDTYNFEQYQKFDRLYEIKSYIDSNGWIPEAEDIVPWLEANLPALEEFRKGADKKARQVNLFYSPAWPLTTYNMSQRRDNLFWIVGFARTYSIYLIHLGKLAEAIQIRMDIMRVGNIFMQSPMLLDYLYGYNDYKSFFSGLKDIILNKDISSEELTYIRDELGQIKTGILGPIKTLKTERAITRALMIDLYRGYINYDDLREMITNPMLAGFKVIYGKIEIHVIRNNPGNVFERIGRFFKNLRYPLSKSLDDVKAYYDLTEELAVLPPNEALARIAELKALVKKLETQDSPVALLLSHPDNPFTGYTQALLNTEIYRTMAALELFKRANGKYPTSLEELVPQYLEAVPIDAASGKPLLYRLDEGKYLLWSVGENLVDDGGQYTYEFGWHYRQPDYVVTSEILEAEPFEYKPATWEEEMENAKRFREFLEN